MDKGFIQVEHQCVLMAFTYFTGQVGFSGREGTGSIVYMRRSDMELDVVFIYLQSGSRSDPSHGGRLMGILQALSRLLSNYANLGLLDMVVRGSKRL